MAPRRRAFRLSARQPEVTREELDEELTFHVEKRTRALVARGLTNEHAQTEALRKLGGTVHEVGERLQSSAERKEKRIDMRERIRDLLDDVRYALRGLARRPAFGAIAIVTLALGIGANTAIFSAIDALLLRALPFEKPDRLVDVTLLAPGEGDTQWSWGKAQVFLEAQRSYQSVALYATLGIVIDVPAAYAATGVLGAGLFNVSTTDPATYVAIVLLVSVAALVASWLPARVAVRVDPIIALRRN